MLAKRHEVVSVTTRIRDILHGKDEFPKYVLISMALTTSSVFGNLVPWYIGVLASASFVYLFMNHHNNASLRERIWGRFYPEYIPPFVREDRSPRKPS